MNKISNDRYCVLSIFIIAVFFISIIISCDGIDISKYYEKGGLATSSPIATEVGINVFKEGGNAFDAAVAVGFTLAVVLPRAGNIGGGGFALIRDADAGKIEALDFREIAPAQAYETMYLDSMGNEIENLSLMGARAVGVPGTVAGLYELWKKKGTIPWEKLVGMAASLADTGFIVDQYLYESIEENQEKLNSYQQTSNTFFPDGIMVKVGDRFTQKKLSKALYLIAAEGPDSFYKGVIADSIIATMDNYEGLLTYEDLLNFEPQWRTPIHFTFDSLDIYMMSLPSSGGIVTKQIMKILETYDVSGYTASSPDYIHLFTEASKLAFADRSKHMGDPMFYNVPLETLLNDDYIRNRGDKIDKNHAKPIDSIKPGNIPYYESDETTHFSITDEDGNVVSLTYTLNTPYGSKLMVNGFGFLLNNQMNDFSIKPGASNYYGLVGGEANKIEPGKKMLSSMSPTIVLNNDNPFLVLGSSGGSKIITTVAQAIINFTRYQMPLNEVVSHPRFHHQWIPDILYLEEGGYDINVKQDLIKLGQNVKERTRYSDLQMLYINTSGFISGASDVRTGGAFGGF